MGPSQVSRLGPSGRLSPRRQSGSHRLGEDRSPSNGRVTSRVGCFKPRSACGRRQGPRSRCGGRLLLAPGRKYGRPRAPVPPPALLAALLATACASVPPEALPAQIDRVDDAPPPETVPSEPATTTTTLPDPIEFTGAIAVGGLPGLVISSTTGELLTVAPDEPQGWGTQPTWSRDGTRAVAVVTSAAGPEVVVASSNDTFTHPARRPYFFFSWSGDGRYIAALGPGPEERPSTSSPPRVNSQPNNSSTLAASTWPGNRAATASSFIRRDPRARPGPARSRDTGTSGGARSVLPRSRVDTRNPTDRDR